MLGQLDTLRHPDVGLGLMRGMVTVSAPDATADDIALGALITADDIGVGIAVVDAEPQVCLPRTQAPVLPKMK